MPQFDLFGEPINGAGDSPKTTSRKSEVHAAPPSAESIAVAGQLPQQLYLGTSSWSYPGWDGLVYAGKFSDQKLARDGLPAYSKHLLYRTVGIDRTFYAPIAERDYALYAAQVPDGFRFLVKAPMAITSSYVRSEVGGNAGVFSDSPYFLDVDYAINEFIAPLTAGLGAKAGPLVFQFPPQGRQHTRHVDAWINRLYRFLKALPPGFLYAVEIRDAELLTDRFLMCLKTTGVRLCVASHANMPSPHEQIEKMNRIMEPGAFVARWSLHSGFKYADAKARYFPFNRLVDEDLDGRASLAAACLRAVEANFPAFVIVNNKAEGSAPLSIEKLAAHVVNI
jgi:uncharacterized protein YecE (DUF72 family)